MGNIKVLLGKKIKELRKSRGLTQEKLAELAGIEIPSLSNIENGKNYPNNETLEKIALALRIKPYQLFIFDYHRNYEDLIAEMTASMQKNENLTRKMYQFYECIK